VAHKSFGLLRSCLILPLCNMCFSGSAVLGVQALFCNNVEVLYTYLLYSVIALGCISQGPCSLILGRMWICFLVPKMFIVAGREILSSKVLGGSIYTLCASKIAVKSVVFYRSISCMLYQLHRCCFHMDAFLMVGCFLSGLGKLCIDSCIIFGL
jgi:hypothetical protein